MTARFQELFEETGGEAIEFEGREVHGAYRRTIYPGTLIDLEFLSMREDRQQGVDLGDHMGLPPESYPVSGYEGPDFASLVLRVSFRVARG